MTRWQHPPEREPGRGRDPFDPIVEGRRYGLSGASSLAIWERACADVADRAGPRDVEQARQRFHALAARAAAPAEVGKATRVGVELEGDLPATPRGNASAGQVPGRTTRVAVDERRRMAELAAAMLPGRARQPGPFSAAVLRSAERTEIGPDAAALVARARRGGVALDAELQRRLEASLGTELHDVRVHTDADADAAARALGARAFAVGHDVFFRAGAYDPHGRAGQRLIAHEVAHTVQARGAAAPVSGTMTVSQPEDAVERQADAFAEEFVRPARVEPSGPPARQAASASALGAVPSGVIHRTPPDIDDDDWKEMLDLDKREITALLAGIEALPESKRTKYEGEIDKAWGVDPKRMRLAFKAVTAKAAGTSAKDFAFANWELCRALYMGQRQSVFKYVEPGLKDPPKIEPGDMVTFKDGRQGIVHHGEVLRQKAKGQVPWMANNPGGLASAGILQATRRYPGKKVDGRLDIFPSFDDGLEGIREFLRVLARKEPGLDRTVEGYFRAHAPAPLPVDPKEKDDPALKKKNDAQRHATAGNDPDRYTNNVLTEAGWPQAMRAKKLSDLTADEFEKLAKSIAQVGEGYFTTVGDTLRWPAQEKELDRDTWWSVVYWEHG